MWYAFRHSDINLYFYKSIFNILGIFVPEYFSFTLIFIESNAYFICSSDKVYVKLGLEQWTKLLISKIWKEKFILVKAISILKVVLMFLKMNRNIRQHFMSLELYYNILILIKLTTRLDILVQCLALFPILSLAISFVFVCFPTFIIFKRFPII